MNKMAILTVLGALCLLPLGSKEAAAGYPFPGDPTLRPVIQQPYGVSCPTCHQVSSQDPFTPFGFNGLRPMVSALEFYQGTYPQPEGLNYASPGHNSYRGLTPEFLLPDGVMPVIQYYQHPEP